MMRTAKAMTLALMAAIFLAAAPTPAPKAPTAPTATNQKLLNPAALNAQAPATYKVKFQTSKGDFVIEVTRAWAPNGADRFYNLVKNGYYDGARFFRVIKDFMVQFGINGDPAVNAVWQNASIPDDPVLQSNKRGMVTYAMRGPDTRTTQVFINYADRNAGLDSQGFAPFGVVVEGMDVVDTLYADYGEGAPQGNGPDQGRSQSEGNAYLTKSFPNLDYTKKATIMPAEPKKAASTQPAK
jgi:peptidyl-prolyl cis-trans isomerase A (cyclophilin A)